MKQEFLNAANLAASIEGWMQFDDLVTLVQCAADVKAGQPIVEIGTYRGRTTAALALGSRLGVGNQVVTIDPHLEFEGARGGTFGPVDQEHLYRNLAHLGIGATVAVVCLPSHAVAQSWALGQIGMLMIDGDHRFESVIQDWRAWRPHLAEGAIVAFDDMDYPDVRLAVEQWLSTEELDVVSESQKLGAFRFHRNSLTPTA